ncbi:MAG TPA: FMN-binding protein [Clostridia bacterium]
MKKILKSVAVLTVISIICGAILTVANYFWKVEEPLGISAALLKELRTVINDNSAEFVELDVNSLGLNEDILNVYKATAGENTDIVIIQTKGTAGSFGDVVMLTAINTSDDTVIAAQKYKDETTRPIDINYDKAKGLKNDALQNTNFDVVSGATYTSNALSYALKLSMSEYAAHKEAILNAPEKSYDLMTISVKTKQDAQGIEIGQTVEILIEVTSNNTKKVDPNKVNFEFTLTRDGKVATAPKNIKKVSSKDNVTVYSVNIVNVSAATYKLHVKATYKKVSATDSVEFTPISLSEQIIKRMFEGTTEVSLVKKDEVSSVKIYKNNLNNYVFAYENDKYDYGESTIYIAFDEQGNISAIDGKVTNTIGFKLTEYLETIKGKHATFFIGYENPDEIDLDVVSGATYTSNAIKATVAKICTFYNSIEDINDYLSNLGE